MATAAEADELRGLLSRCPAGVCIVTVAVGEQKLGLTVLFLDLDRVLLDAENVWVERSTHAHREGVGTHGAG